MLLRRRGALELVRPAPGGAIRVRVAARAGRGDRVHGGELRLRDPSRAPAVAAALDRRMAPRFLAESWGQLNKNLFDLLRLQKTALVIVLLLVIAVEG